MRQIVTKHVDLVPAPGCGWPTTLQIHPSALTLTGGSLMAAERAAFVNGLRDLMWVLLNTKEFIVNH